MAKRTYYENCPGQDHESLGWPCSHCTFTGTEPFTNQPCSKGCNDGFVKYLGYHEDKDLPVKDGDRVRIRAGTRIRTMTKGWHFAARTYVVKVHHLLNGMDKHTNYHQEELPAENPKVRWAGPGGYWSEADINDVELVTS